MSTAPKTIKCLRNGPYSLNIDTASAGVSHLCRAGGETFETGVGKALCRCGGSKNKPFCDGTHRTNGFSDQKTADDKHDRRENYVGQRITIHDNRGICAHAGACTDGLKSVFRMKQEPWIDPDGANVAEIIETIKKCPSGALSYSIDNVEHRDHDRKPM